MNPEDFGITNYKIRFGRLNVDGDVDLSSKQLTEIPFNFGEVKGKFDISDNQIKSLKNSPTSVWQSFSASHNSLTSIDYYPNIIKKYSRSHTQLYLGSNQLTDLSGLNRKPFWAKLPTMICFQENPLKSVKEFPKNHKVKLNLCLCGLTSLEGLKLSKGSSLEIQKNNLTSLVGLESSELFDLTVFGNSLSNFDGFPEVISYLNISHNKFNTLVGMPKVSHWLDCSNNQIKQIFLPNNFIEAIKSQDKLIGNFIFYNNPLLDISVLDNLNLSDEMTIVKFKKYPNFEEIKVEVDKNLELLKKRQFVINNLK